MRHLVLMVAVVILPLAANAQMGGGGMGMMGPGMGGGMGMGMGMGAASSPSDVHPLWSPNGKWIAFARAVQGQQDPGKAGLLDASATTPAAEPAFIGANLEPLAWLPDSSGLICGYRGAGGLEQYGGFWLVSAADPKKITLVQAARTARHAEVSPDKTKVLLVDERGTDTHEMWVGPANAAGKLLFVARDGIKYIQSGWTNDSQHIWLLAEIPTKGAPKRGDALPEAALKSSGGMGGGMGMMGGGMGGGMGPGMGGGMGPGMGGGMGMMGPGMGMGGGPALTKKVLMVMALDGTEPKKIGEDIEFVAWSPTSPTLAVLRRVQVEAPAGGGGDMGPGMGGGGMGPGMGGGMGPGMGGGLGPGMGGGMGMMGGMGMGGGATTDEYLAIRPATSEEEQRIGDPQVPIKTPVWSPDGKLLLGMDPVQRRVFYIAPPAGPMFEAGQDADDAVRAVGAAAWSPDGTRIAYSGLVDAKEGEDTVLLRGIFVRDLTKTQAVRLSENKSKMAAMGGMGGGMGMMGGMGGGMGMMGGMGGGMGMMGPGMGQGD